MSAQSLFTSSIFLKELILFSFFANSLAVSFISIHIFSLQSSSFNKNPPQHQKSIILSHLFVNFSNLNLFKIHPKLHTSICR